MRRFGLIGYPLGHSYSKRYFENKFEKLELDDHIYQLFEMEFLKEFPTLWSNQRDLVGVNVTVPHKENVIKFLDGLDMSAQKVGAVNVIKKEGGKLRGYNTDYFAFKDSLEDWLEDSEFEGKALILGSGGASKAVSASLKDLEIPFSQASRMKSRGDISYDQLTNEPEIIKDFKLVINTTPLGMKPKVDTCPEIPYDLLDEGYWLYDLVYNPETTLFMKKGLARGAKVKNGYEMLISQAKKSWEIWRS